MCFIVCEIQRQRRGTNFFEDLADHSRINFYNLEYLLVCNGAVYFKFVLTNIMCLQ
jgi:hypothetical protein